MSLQSVLHSPIVQQTTSTSNMRSFSSIQEQQIAMRQANGSMQTVDDVVRQ